MLDSTLYFHLKMAHFAPIPIHPQLTIQLTILADLNGSVLFPKLHYQTIKYNPHNYKTWNTNSPSKWNELPEI
jgi:hypothetical protein